MSDHPRHELEQDADALGRVALIADELAGLARNGDPNADPPIDPDPEAASRVEGEAVILRNWEQLCRTAKAATPVHHDEDTGTQ